MPSIIEETSLEGAINKECLGKIELQKVLQVRVRARPGPVLESGESCTKTIDTTRMPHFFAVWYRNPSNKTSVKGVSLQARNSVIYSLSAHSAQPSLTDSILGIDGAVWLQLDLEPRKQRAGSKRNMPWSQRSCITRFQWQSGPVLTTAWEQNKKKIYAKVPGLDNQIQTNLPQLC